MEELSDLLALADFVPEVSVHLAKIIEVMLRTSEPKADYEETYANSAWILGSCMQALAKRPLGEWEERIDLETWLRTAVEKWGWSDVVLGGVVDLVRARWVACCFFLLIYVVTLIHDPAPVVLLENHFLCPISIRFFKTLYSPTPGPCAYIRYGYWCRRI